jgi:hypothetical protein
MVGWIPRRPDATPTRNRGTYAAHRMLVPALVLAMSTPAGARDKAPTATGNLKPDQTVEAMAVPAATDPLQHHTAGGAVVLQSTESESPANDPFSIGANGLRMVEARRGRPTNPLTQGE